MITSFQIVEVTPVSPQHSLQFRFRQLDLYVRRVEEQEPLVFENVVNEGEHRVGVRYMLNHIPHSHYVKAVLTEIGIEDVPMDYIVESQFIPCDGRSNRGHFVSMNFPGRIFLHLLHEIPNATTDIQQAPALPAMNFRESPHISRALCPTKTYRLSLPGRIRNVPS